MALSDDINALIEHPVGGLPIAVFSSDALRPILLGLIGAEPEGGDLEARVDTLEVDVATAQATADDALADAATANAAALAAADDAATALAAAQAVDSSNFVLKNAPVATANFTLALVGATMRLAEDTGAETPATEFGRSSDGQTGFFNHERTAGNAVFGINPMPLDGTSAAIFSMWRETNTTGRKGIDAHKGDGTSTVYATWDLDEVNQGWKLNKLEVTGRALVGGTFGQPFIIRTVRLWADSSHHLWYKEDANPSSGSDGFQLTPAVARFRSAANDTFVANTPFSAAHGLSEIWNVWAEAVCTSANNGWLVGDTVIIHGAAWIDDGADRGIVFSHDATNVTAVIGFDGLYITGKGSGSGANATVIGVTNAAWDLHLCALGRA